MTDISTTWVVVIFTNNSLSKDYSTWTITPNTYIILVIFSFVQAQHIRMYKTTFCTVHMITWKYDFWLIVNRSPAESRSQTKGENQVSHGHRLLPLDYTPLAGLPSCSGVLNHQTSSGMCILRKRMDSCYFLVLFERIINLAHLPKVVSYFIPNKQVKYMWTGILILKHKRHFAIMGTI